MIYNDNQIINNNQLRQLEDSYKHIDAQTTNDLQELYDRMLAQRNLMQSNNINNALDNVISTTNRHLLSLEKIIKNSNGTATNKHPFHSIYHIQETLPTPYPHLRPYINLPNANFPNNFNNMNPLPQIPSDNLNNTLPPTQNGNNNQQPSTPNTPMQNGNSRLPNTNNNVPNIGDNSVQPPFNDNNQNIIKNPLIDGSNNNNNSTMPNVRRRNSPLQGNIISTFVKSIFGGLNKSKNIIIDDKYRNRFHNISVQSESCNPHRKMITNELDILRLLLLFIYLRPHHRHTKTLSNIATEQLEVLSLLV